MRLLILIGLLLTLVVSAVGSSAQSSTHDAGKSQPFGAGQPAGQFGGQFGGKKAAANDVFNVKEPMTATLRFQPSSVEPGQTAELLVDLNLATGFHAYADRFKIVIETPDDFKLDGYKVAPLVPFKDSVSKSVKEGVQGKATLRAQIEVPTGFKAGHYQPRIKLTYQACTDEFCLFPKSVELNGEIEVRGAVAAAAEANAPSRLSVTGASASEFHAALEKGIFSALLLMFVVGFLTSLTPCIYPMIPITLAVLGVRAPRNGQKPSHWRSFSLSVAYVLGLCTTYSTLGVVAASTGGLFGSALSNVWVVSVIAFVFVLMGVSMYGHFEVQAPAFIRNRLGGSSSNTQGGYGGAFATGLIAGVIASPCIGPVLVSVLAYIAQSQDRLLGFALLFSFALGMGMLFLILGVSSSLLGRLPKAGPWMETVKYFFGTVMIGMAFYYVQPIYPQWLFLSLLGVAGILIASVYGAFDPLDTFTSLGRLRKGVMLAVFFFGIALATAGVMIRAGLMAPGTMSPTSALSTSTASASIWTPYTPETLAAAKGKPIIIDFSAEWCGSCKELEELTYPKVANEMKRFALLKVDATESTPAVQEYTAKYGIAGLPTLLFFDADGRARPELSLVGFEDAAAFAKRLESVK